MPAVLSDTDIAFNFGMFLRENTGSIGGVWEGKIRVADQRKLAFRNFSGKKTAYLNGKTQRIIVTQTVCFGTDYDYTVDTTWAKFERGENF
jgi:hypothetical protein